MATVNIGNLTFTHKGDYASGTAYVKNDVVYYSTNGNAYIAKQGTTGNAPTNATYWNQFAQGSGGIWNAGLSLGSASQKLRVNSGGSALEFFTEPAVTSDFVKVAQGETTSADNISFDSVFATGTYKSYVAIVSYSIVNNAWLKFRWRNSSSDISNGQYRWIAHGNKGLAGSAGDEHYRGWDNDFAPITYWSQKNGYSSVATIEFGNPANANGKKLVHVHSAFFSNSDQIWNNNIAFFHNSTNTFDGFKIFSTASGFSNMSVQLYGRK